MRVKTIPFLWQFVKNYKFSFIGSLIVVLFVDLMDLVGGNTVLKNFIDNITNDRLDFNNALLMILLYVFLSSFNTIFSL